MIINLENLLKQEQKFIALDAGSFSLRAAAFRIEDGQTVIEKTAEFPIRRDDLFKFTGIDPLKSFISENGYADYRLTFCAAGTGIIIRYLNLPKIPESELPVAVAFEAKKELPFALDEAEIDFMILGEIEVENNRKLRAVVCACKKDELSRYHTLASLLGMKMISITVNPAVSMNLLTLSGKEYRNDVIAHIDFGFQNTSVNIINCGHLEFSRVLPMGAYHVDEALAEVIGGGPLNILENLGKASALKKEQGLTGENRQAVESIKDSVNSLLQRIRLSIGYYKTQTGVKKIDRLLLTGGMSGMPGIGPFMGENLEAESELFSPEYSGMRFEQTEDQIFFNCFATVIGTIHEASPDLCRLNLLAKNLRPKKEISLSSSEDLLYVYNFFISKILKIIPNPTIFFIIIYTGLLIVMAAPVAYYQGNSLLNSKRLSDIKKTLAVKNSDLGNCQSVKSQLTAKEEELRQKSDIFSTGIDWSDLFLSLSHTVTDETIVVDSLSFKLTQMTYSFALSGKTTDAARATDAALSLGGCPYFTDVFLENTAYAEGSKSRSENKKKVIFSLKGIVRKKNEQK